LISPNNKKRDCLKKRGSLAEEECLLSNAIKLAGGWEVSNPSGITVVIGLTPIGDAEGGQARREIEI
jgi:hypothetical protein